uniref:Retroviral polymerase SH3-like domain-containing protein n=1 Tax=Trichogramma kaykai TaxID=54128 RepID=A0ABD2WA86_9HYME
MWFACKPDLSHIHTFGSECFTQVLDIFRKKWDPKTFKLIVVGFENESANYRLFDSDTGAILVSRHFTFNENTLAPKDDFEEAEL